MKKFPLGLVVTAIVCFPKLLSQAAGSAPPAALKTFLEHEGFGGCPLQRRLGNHLFVTTIMNQRKGALMIDTGSPRTLIDRASVRDLGLAVERDLNDGKLYFRERASYRRRRKRY